LLISDEEFLKLYKIRQVHRALDKKRHAVPCMDCGEDIFIKFDCGSVVCDLCLIKQHPNYWLKTIYAKYNIETSSSNIEET